MEANEPRIVVDPEIRFGKPRVRGTRVTVGDILGWLASGMSVDEMISDFPDLTKNDVQAALGFAADRGRRSVLIAAA